MQTGYCFGTESDPVSNMKRGISMKKLICVLLVIVALTSLLAGCVSYFECDLCGEEKFGVKHTDEVMGIEVEYCDECKEALDSLGGLLK